MVTLFTTNDFSQYFCLAVNYRSYQEANWNILFFIYSVKITILINTKLIKGDFQKNLVDFWLRFEVWIQSHCIPFGTNSI